MGIKTRGQRDLIETERLVSSVAEEKEQVRRIYGGLCHSFPVLVRTCGLCQALAFSEGKAASQKGKESHRNRAHELLLAHVADLMEVGRQGLLTAVAEWDTVEYMMRTRRLLAASVFLKRFAVSILKVEDARAGEEDGDAE